MVFLTWLLGLPQFVDRKHWMCFHGGYPFSIECKKLFYASGHFVTEPVFPLKSSGQSVVNRGPEKAHSLLRNEERGPRHSHVEDHPASSENRHSELTVTGDSHTKKLIRRNLRMQWDLSRRRSFVIRRRPLPLM
jgi:hypothetical protein